MSRALAWEPLKDASRAGRIAPQRLVQMRDIVRRYSAAIQIDGESDLRLMAQPLYRYPEASRRRLDGAIFRLCHDDRPGIAGAA